MLKNKFRLIISVIYLSATTIIGAIILGLIDRMYVTSSLWYHYATSTVISAILVYVYIQLLKIVCGVFRDK